MCARCSRPRASTTITAAPMTDATWTRGRRRSGIASIRSSAPVHVPLDRAGVHGVARPADRLVMQLVARRLEQHEVVVHVETDRGQRRAADVVLPQGPGASGDEVGDSPLRPYALVEVL